MAESLAPPAAPEPSAPKIELSAEKEAEYERITRNLAEMTSGEIIRKVLSEGEVVRAYWGELMKPCGLEQE